MYTFPIKVETFSLKNQNNEHAQIWISTSLAPRYRHLHQNERRSFISHIHTKARRRFSHVRDGTVKSQRLSEIERGFWPGSRRGTLKIKIPARSSRRNRRRRRPEPSVVPHGDLTRFSLVRDSAGPRHNVRSEATLVVFSSPFPPPLPTHPGPVRRYPNATRRRTLALSRH